MAAIALGGNITVFPETPSRKSSSSTKRAKTSTAKTASRTGTKKSVPVREQAIHVSKVLRDLLAKNDDKKFSVEKIVDSLGGSSAFGSSLLLFSIPEVLPIPLPGMTAIVVIPTAVISAQMIAGNQKLQLPKYILRRTIPRKALAASIHSILPILERMERYVKPRWTWATHPISKRFIGLFVFILAAGIALPIPGTNMPLAFAIFIISLGLIENDGLMIFIGILIGLASLVLLGGIFFAALSLLGLI